MSRKYHYYENQYNIGGNAEKLTSSKSNNTDNLLEESKSDLISTGDQNEEEEEEILFVRNKKTPVPIHSSTDTDLSQKVELPLKMSQPPTESDESPKGVQDSQTESQADLQEKSQDNSQGNLDDSQKSHQNSANNSNENQDPQENPQEKSQEKSQENPQEKSKDPNEAEQREATLRLIRAKRDEVFHKIQVINALHQQIANLGVPAAHDVSKLRKKIDIYLLQIKELKEEDRRASEAIDRSIQIQKKLKQQMLSLNEKKKEAIFEFENKHLIQLKAIEEEIRQMM